MTSGNGHGPGKQRPDIQAHDPTAEEAVIGSCLIDPQAIDRVTPDLTPADFFILRNAWIFEAACDLDNHGIPIDFVVLSNELRQRGQLDEIGGPGRLMELINTTPSAGMNAEYYAEIVREKAAERRRAKAILDAGEAVNAGDLAGAARILQAAAEPGHDLSIPPLRYFTAGESLDPLPPVDWVVKDIIRAGSLSALVGGPKIGKSYACIDLGVCVAMGRDWLGRQVKQCPVVYVDEENGEILMRQRLAMVLRGHGIEDRDIPFHVLPMQRINFGAKVDRDRLTGFIAERAAGLVIVDSLIDALTLAGAKESASEDQMRVWLLMQDVAVETGAAFFVNHHENRSGTYRGSSVLPGVVEMMLSIKGKKGEARLDFEIELSRSTELLKFAALKNFGPDTFRLTAAQHVADNDAPHFSKSQDFVMRYLQVHGAAKVKDIMLGADTCTQNAARAAVYSLTSIGRLYRVNPGEPGDAVYDRVGIDLNHL